MKLAFSITLTYLKTLQNFTAMTQTKIATRNLSEVGEDIGLAEGEQMITSFRTANPEATQGYYIGKNIINQILSQPGCAGINFRKCLTKLNEEHLVYTGVDADGKDIIEYSAVTSTGDIVKQDAIVADRVWIIKSTEVDEATRTIFDA